MKAFRCRNCGHLVHGEHAGDQAVPYACPVCSGGVKWDNKGNKTFCPENWEVLADATPERLKELGLCAEEVHRHTPKKTAISNIHNERSAVDSVITKDR